MSAEDVYHNKIENLSNLSEVFMSNCFNKCHEDEETPFLTISEGLCFRNCMTKFCVWYPTLKRNMPDSAAFFHEQKLHDHLMNDESYAANSTDPWKDTMDELL